MKNTLLPFDEFPSIARLSRAMVVTEKIDGTNAQICIAADGEIRAGSRNRWLTPEADNFGFAVWVRDHADGLLALGLGRHFGEWWGSGIQRKYGLKEKRFSLFNTARWTKDEGRVTDKRLLVPECVHVVPVLAEREVFDTAQIEATLTLLSATGSMAAPGFMKPEGVVVFHVASNALFKKTLDKNDGHKSVHR